MLIVFLLLIVISAIASWVGVAVLMPQLCRGFLDQPNLRSSHREPTPRGGGLSLVIVTTCAILILTTFFGFTIQTYMALFVVPLAVVGFLDDRHNLPAWIRFVVQLFTAVGLMLLSPLSMPLWAILLLLFSVVAVINFINFMDGLDGLVAGCMLVVFTVAALLVCPCFWPLTGALLGFLPWNWSPAKVFMGDVGSTYLGALLVGAVLQSPTWTQALGLLLVATPLLGDACFCVLRRAIAGERVYEPHRQHIYQRLHQAGWSHARVSAAYIATTALLAFTFLIAGWTWVSALAVIVLLAGYWIDRRIASPFELSSSTLKG